MPTERDLVATRLSQLADGESLQLPCQVNVTRISAEGWQIQRGEEAVTNARNADRAAQAALTLAREARTAASKLST